MAVNFLSPKNSTEFGFRGFQLVLSARTQVFACPVSDDGDRQMVAILAAVLTDGLPAVESACAQAMSEGVHASDVILNILARQRDPGPAATILTPDALTLRHAPVADCARYDQLRSA